MTFESVGECRSNHSNDKVMFDGRDCSSDPPSMKASDDEWTNSPSGSSERYFGLKEEGTKFDEYVRKRQFEFDQSTERVTRPVAIKN